VSRIDTYRQYRDIGPDLNSRIFSAELGHDEIMESAEMLGIDVDGKDMRYDDEEQAVTHMDFALNDYRIEDQTAIERYHETEQWETDTEREVLEYLLQAETSLFKVTAVDENQSRLVLTDVVSGETEISLTDISSSKTAEVGMVIFLRLVPCDGFNMTSGISLPFPDGSEDHLVTVYEKVLTTDTSLSPDVVRFRTFFELYQKYGHNARYV
jgi:hypothetical protein